MEPSTSRRPSIFEREVALLDRDIGLAPEVEAPDGQTSPSPCQSSDRTIALGADGGASKDEDDLARQSSAKGKEKATFTGEEVEGYSLVRDGDRIWVDFEHESRFDPFHFSKARKWYISVVAILFTFWTSANLSAYASGQPSMIRDLGATELQSAAGLGLYAWGFAIFPLVLAPFSEEFGRRPVYISTAFLYWLFLVPTGVAKNIETVLIFRFLSGGVGSVGATLVGGSLADVWVTSERGTKMAIFAFCAVFGTAFTQVPMSWVEMNTSLEWRWIQWIQLIIVGAYLPSVFMMPETRSTIILAKKAASLRKERGEQDGATYWARAEVGKPKLIEMMKLSMTRPIYLLVTEPTVTFFALWIAVAWGVLYGEVESISYTFKLLYHFDEGHIGLVYLSMSIGCILGYLFNFYQEKLYRDNFQRIGAEARLYAAMVGGISFAIGCFIYAWTSFSHVTYVAPCIGIVVMIFGTFSIYLAVFNFLADAYTIYASSALAGQSFLRNMVAGAFPFFSNQLYRNLGVNWASSLFGFLAAVLAIIPFVAFRYGPQIRARSNFAKKLVAEEERLRLKKEKSRASQKA